MWRAKDTGSGPYNDGKWRYLANDLDNTDYLNDGNNNPNIDSFIEGNWYTENGPLVDEGLLSSFIENSEFKERFVSSFMDMMNNNFRYEDVSAKLWNEAEVISRQNVMSQRVFKGPYMNDFYPGENEIKYPYDESCFGYDVGLIDVFFAERPQYMKEYIRRDLKLTGNLYNLKVVGETVPDAVLQINTSVISGFDGEWNGQYFGDYPVILSEASDSGQDEYKWYVNGELVSEGLSYVIPAGFDGDEVVVEIRP